jgi:hypothetical protein
MNNLEIIKNLTTISELLHLYQNVDKVDKSILKHMEININFVIDEIKLRKEKEDNKLNKKNKSESIGYFSYLGEIN